MQDVRRLVPITGPLVRSWEFRVLDKPTMAAATAWRCRRTIVEKTEITQPSFKTWSFICTDNNKYTP